MKLLILLLAVMSITACAERTDKPPRATQLSEPTDVGDQALMVALSQAKNFHHKAKVYMSDGKLDDAIASVREILSLRFPAGAPEAEDVRNDARALLAKLLVTQGRLEDAMTVVTEGLANATRESFFVANLYTVKGEIHEARAAAATDKDKIADERRAAIEAYDRSIQIDKAIQKRLMEER